MTPSALWRGLRGLRARPELREQVLEYQFECLRAVLDHAYRRVPYYRHRLDDARLHPSDIRSVDDLRALPITDRRDLQALGAEELCDSGVRPESLRTLTTSGSTGAPLTVRRTMNEERLLLGFRALATGAFGDGLGARRVQIDHFSAETLAAEGRPCFYERLGILPRLLVDWRTPKQELLSALDRFRPDIINGPPSILSWLASEMTDEDRRRITASMVLTGAETNLPEIRRTIEQGFGLPVADLYGCHEVVFIAMQRPDLGDYRICEEASLVEVLKSDGEPAAPGEAGEVVVTGLHSFAMPFIRYRLGDQVVVGEAQGPYNSLRSIDGRVIDRFQLPSGRVLHGYTLGQVVKMGGLEARRFQITQERRDRFQVRIVAPGAALGQTEPVREAMLDLLEPGVKVQVELVDEIAPQEGGKFYPFVSVERLEAWRTARR